MLTIFNRKELIGTFDMKEQARIRNILADNKVDYTMETINRKSPSPFSAGSRGVTGTFGENPELAYEYIFYVHKNDYEKAGYLIKK